MDQSLNKQLLKLHQNLNILQEREAKFAGQSPLELLNQIADHQRAIELTQLALTGQISKKELEEELKRLNLALGGSVQNFIQMIPLPFLGGGLVIGIVIAISLFLNTTWGQIALGPKPTATPLFTRPATANEFLILVADFDNSGSNINAHEDIYDELKNEIKKLGLTGVRVERTYTKISQEQQLEAWQRVYQPVFIIWGGTDDVRTVTKFSITAPSGEDLAGIPADPIKTLRDLPNFDIIITSEVPEQMAFLVKFTLGQIYFRHNQLQEADKILASALQNYPPKIQAETLATTYFYQGFTSQRLHQFTEALEQYQQAIERNPALYEAYYNRGVAFFDLKQLDEAYEGFTQAINLDQKLPLAYFNRANILRQQGHFEQALQDYNRGLELDPDNANVLLARGEVYKAQGDDKHALADYNQALKLVPNLALGYFFRGQLQRKLGANAEAEADFEKAGALFDPQQDNFWYIKAQQRHAWLAYERGDYQTAIQANQAAIAASQNVTPEEPGFIEVRRCHYNLALVLLADKQTTQAKAEYEIALKLTPTPEILDEFIADLKKLRQAQPNNADIADMLAYLQTRPISQ